MKALRWGVVFTAALLVIGASTSSAGIGSNQPIDDAEDCLEFVPEEVSLTSVTDDGRETTLEVHTLLDGVPIEHAQPLMAAAARPYAEINVKLVPSFEEVLFPASGETAEGAESIDPYELFALAKEHTGGYRPHGADVVYVMTSKELVSSGALGGAVAGQADCIGGVRYPSRAFAVGEVSPDDPTNDHWYGSVIAGHEIGHLMGAHHHYANCAQGNPDDIIEDWTSCTLMFNTVTFISRRFSTAEAAAVRGHALAFADKTPTGPPELIERDVTLSIKRGKARGQIRMDDEITECVAQVEVVIQRSVRGRWSDVRRVPSGDTGYYKTDVPDRGDFRAFVPEMTGHDRATWRTCAEALSPRVRVH